MDCVRKVWNRKGGHWWLVRLQRPIKRCQETETNTWKKKKKTAKWFLTPSSQLSLSKRENTSFVIYLVCRRSGKAPHSSRPVSSFWQKFDSHSLVIIFTRARACETASEKLQQSIDIKSIVLAGGTGVALVFHKIELGHEHIQVPSMGLVVSQMAPAWTDSERSHLPYGIAIRFSLRKIMNQYENQLETGFDVPGAQKQKRRRRRGLSAPSPSRFPVCHNATDRRWNGR